MLGAVDIFSETSTTPNKHDAMGGCHATY